MFETIKKCCASNVPAVIISPDNNAIFEARFAKVADGIVSFELSSPGDTIFRSLSTCCVSYFLDGRAYLFLSVVQAYHLLDSTKTPRLDISHPTEITSTDVRRAFRVPVLAEVGMSVSLMTADRQQHQAMPGDISFGGMMLVFPESEVPDLDVGQRVKVTLTLGEHNMGLKGEIRQRFGSHKNKFGVFFPDCYRGDAFHPPEAYRRIVMGTEKAWLKHRNR